jgi:hypothetical protein
MRFKTPQKIRMVQLFAERLTTDDVIERLRVEFPGLAGVRLPLSSVRHYNPCDTSGHNLSASLREIFFAARTRYDKAVLEKEPGSREWRVAKLLDLVRQNYDNAKLCAELLEQIAKEMGGVYTKKAESDASDGPGELLDIVAMTPEEKAVRLRALMQVDEQLSAHITMLLQKAAN